MIFYREESGLRPAAKLSEVECQDTRTKQAVSQFGTCYLKSSEERIYYFDQNQEEFWEEFLVALGEVSSTQFLFLCDLKAGKPCHLKGHEAGGFVFRLWNTFSPVTLNQKIEEGRASWCEITFDPNILTIRYPVRVAAWLIGKDGRHVDPIRLLLEQVFGKRLRTDFNPDMSNLGLDQDEVLWDEAMRDVVPV